MGALILQEYHKINFKLFQISMIKGEEFILNRFKNK